MLNFFLALPFCVAQLSWLQVLLAQKNSISDVGVKTLSPCLTTLNLSFNLLKAVPAIVYSLSNLQVLILSSNQITEFPAELCNNNKSLKNLDLHTNRIQNVPEEFSNLKKLRRLNIAINQIDYISPSI